MSNEFYYNTKTDTFPERESFNNTILLLTMVKSQYYYIVGFSRPNNMVEIAFDFESDLHSLITESVTLHFDESDKYLVMRCHIKNVSSKMGFAKGSVFKGKGEINNNNGKLIYEYLIPKDNLIPLSIEKMNAYILDAKKEIVDFLEKQYALYICGEGE